MAQTILLFRPEAGAAAFAAGLEARAPGRFRAIAAPPFRIEPVPATIELAGVQGLAFSSANAVPAVATQDARRSLPAWCVGPATAAAALAAGFAAVSAEGDVAALARLIAAEARPGAGDVLHLRGRHAIGRLAERLRALGVPAREVVVYDQPARPLEPAVRRLLAEAGAEVLAFFSPRGARFFAAEAGSAGWPLGGVTAVSISAATDAGLAGLGIGRRVVAASADRQGMLAAVEEL